ncbi:MAG: haloacid dehalogenase type II [Hyphomicrobiales bacterium]|nr:haloacid dehalogenase type II [Hyphomicrobiales bacterium]MCP4999227.1 haloacid dehalogenase type II [Hyphomicrobiales bacterium]
MVDHVKAILFDTFGTIVDWRGSIARMGEKLAQDKGIEGIDWDAFARAWRAGYVPGMAKVRSGEGPWMSVDAIHRERLETILTDFGLAGAFSDGEKAEINLFWHRLDPWPDSVPGLLRLKRDYLLSPLSNGSLVLLSTMAKRAGIPWDFVLSSSTFKAYKPDAAVYLGAIEILDLEPGEVMMVAAHNDDLAAARSHGMRTAYINRPYEYGVDQSVDFQADGDWDVITDTITGLADAMT